jgi:hypothetical protein
MSGALGSAFRDSAGEWSVLRDTHGKASLISVEGRAGPLLSQFPGDCAIVGPLMMRLWKLIPVLLVSSSCFSEPAGQKSALPEAAKEDDPGLTLSWSNEMLAIHGAGFPGGKLEVWYLEAFCRSGSTDREWAQTVIPHRTEKLEESTDARFLKLRSQVEGDVEVVHEIRAGRDEVDFRVTATNHGTNRADVVWVQPCMRVGTVTGRAQNDYHEKCFIFVDDTLTTLDKTRREVDALYKGGQVYVPRGVDRKDVNPRPLSEDEPSNGIIGCFSADGSRILAMAWEPYQELFQGVIVCIHSDFRLGGLEPGEVKKAHGKIYFVENDPEKLLERYRKDFRE